MTWIFIRFLMLPEMYFARRRLMSCEVRSRNEADFSMHLVAYSRLRRKMHLALQSEMEDASFRFAHRGLQPVVSTYGRPIARQLLSIITAPLQNKGGTRRPLYAIYI